jgi:AcrR family transcriptional regulator
MPRRRVARPDHVERTRRRLLASASEVFARTGFHGATLEEITCRAGLSRAAVYRHFPSKDALFVEMMRAQVAAELGELPAAGHVPADAKGEADVDAVIRQLLSLERWHRACLEFRASHPEWRPSPELDLRLRELLLELCPNGGDDTAADDLARAIEALARGFHALALDGLGHQRTGLFTATVHALLDGARAEVPAYDSQTPESQTPQRQRQKPDSQTPEPAAPTEPWSTT